MWKLARSGLRWLLVFVVLGLIGGFLMAWSGLYSVAASRGHWPFFNTVLAFAMRNSVRTHAFWIEVPDLENRALIERGAAHYQAGCAPCHGAPGRSGNPIASAMLPAPPDLRAAVPHWKPRELFWIVKHGLKYTGMPAWPAPLRDDEVWAVTAFLQKLPDMNLKQYAELAGPGDSSLTACARCHGVDGRGRASGAFPRLDIQNSDYLFKHLLSYAEGTRPSGFMQPVAAELSRSEMRRLADSFGKAVPAESAGSSAQEDGRKLATQGIAAQSIPACLSCHSQAARYPAIKGQYADFIAAQLELFRTGKRSGTAEAAIMTDIAKRLSPWQIEAVAAYLERP